MWGHCTDRMKKQATFVEVVHGAAARAEQLFALAAVPSAYKYPQAAHPRTRM